LIDLHNPSNRSYRSTSRPGSSILSTRCMKSLFESLGLSDPPQETLQPVPTVPLTKATAKAFCRELLASPEYRMSLVGRMISGELPPALECKIWEYAYGRPVDRVEIDDKRGKLEELSSEQLEERAMKLMMLARQMRETELELSSEPEDEESVH
jgi:hypothetical protein